MQYYRRIERSIAAGERPSLRIANRRGELVVIGEDRDDIAFTAQVSVFAHTEREGQSRLDAVQIPISQEGGRVDIGPPELGEEHEEGISIFGIRVGIHPAIGGRVDMEVRVPRLCEVEAEQRAGPLRVAGLRRGLRATNRSGRSELRDIEGGVAIESRSGSVEAHEVRGPLSVDVRSGKVEVEGVEGETRVSSRSGAVGVRDVRGGVFARGRAGRIRIEEAEGPVEVVNQAGSVELRGRVAHPVVVDVQTGSVRLAVTRDSAFFLDAESHIGSVRSDLPVGYIEEPPSDAPVVRLRTHTGSIRIVAA